ncbi:MAG: nickel pincer cofactor biosynthesis protein LarB [Coriobacteriia bacterium]|nr:nickel pincer cofactor biosynthesis protein LarB [Coriobacteriia bacterium]
MHSDSIIELLRSVAEGALSPEDAVHTLGDFSTASLSEQGRVEARIDHHRAVRCGFPEVIFCQGKTPEQVARISEEILSRSDVLLATRCDSENAEAFASVADDAVIDTTARLAWVDRRTHPVSEGLVVVASGGTADIPVAEEAARTAELMGCRVSRLYDVGVAGVHRVLEHTELLRDARVLVAVAGMEGALPSLVAGLVEVPVVAVPTSVGYGANFGGVSALLTMLNSCAGGIGVVNIDNGFGAGLLAARINRPAWAAALDATPAETAASAEPHPAP